MRERYDVIVVGARVGGSALAALLGVQGVSVLLLDRAQFPSTTSSTRAGEQSRLRASPGSRHGRLLPLGTP
jgi:flavin-dependent dehydrogenase